MRYKNRVITVVVLIGVLYGVTVNKARTFNPTGGWGPYMVVGSRAPLPLVLAVDEAWDGMEVGPTSYYLWLWVTLRLPIQTTWIRDDASRPVQNDEQSVRNDDTDDRRY